MAIDGGLRDKLEPGTRLVARYKGAEYTAEVVAGEGGKARYRLTDGREFKSPSAAGSAVMGGQACNGWRFWSVANADQDNAPSSEASTRSDGVARTRPTCPRCGKSFVGDKQLTHHAEHAARLCLPA